ncbi:MAG: hypothetical protein A2Z75_06250 [Chloroflexi bacterium RBG_13_50_10]|nr:MAG: hypothetical protein A2Z75_06250 [Chloroflexi bacterium RBG_13_50_10]
MREDAEITSRSATYSLEVHVFEHEGYYFAFDVRNFSILKLDVCGAAVLSRMHDLFIDSIMEKLGHWIPPEVIWRSYRRFLELIRDGVLSSEPVPHPARPPFDHLVLMLAGGCNMGCTYCFEKDIPVYQDTNLLTYEKADEILSWFFRHQEGRKAHVQLYGGEPLLNWRVLQHIVERLEGWARVQDVELSIYLITNGTLLNSERMAFLKAHDIAIQVSVDGDAKTHDRFRVFKSGKPTMYRIKPNIRELARQGIRFNLRAVLTRQNKSPASVIDGLRSLGAKRVSFEVVATDCVDARFTHEDWEVFNEEYRNFVRAPYKVWDKIPDDMQSMIIRICEHRQIFYGCGAGISEVTVAPDGSIYECQRMYPRPCSNVVDDKSPNKINSHFLTMVDDRPLCRDCWVRYLCGGGCMHQSYLGHGKSEPLPQFCTMKRNLAEASIAKIYEIRSANKVVADYSGY